MSDHPSRPKMFVRLALALGVSAALAFRAPLAFGDDPGGKKGGGDNAGVGLHGGPGGSGPGGPIGGGLNVGVGGPTGLGSGHGAGGGGGGGGASPLSPLSSDHDFRPPGFGGGREDGGRGGDSLSPLSASSSGPGRGDDGGDGAGRGRGVELSDLLKKADHDGGDGGKDGKHGLEDANALTEAAEVAGLTQSRQVVVRQLLHDHPDAVEPDGYGHAVVRGQILAVGPGDAELAKARAAGFRVLSEDSLGDLGLKSAVLLAPRGVSAPEALRRIRAMDPHGQYDLNHLYQESGEVRRKPAPARTSAEPPPEAPKRGVRIGLVDGGVAAAQPTFAGDQVVQKGFAPGGPKPTAHATAVASLLAGHRPPFRGAAPGATLYVADVYGSTPAGGSASAIARALGWLSAAGTPVINVSLVGPPNLLLEAAVRAVIERGHVVVAAVGNDGPAAPPLYPASYPGVIAVTGVDARRRVLPEAGRGTHVDFAAPGSDMAAAGLDGGFVAVRGTSFAAPIAAGLLARLDPTASPQAAARAVSVLSREALDMGRVGPDPVYGHGLVGVELRTAPAVVQARMALKGP